MRKFLVLPLTPALVAAAGLSRHLSIVVEMIEVNPPLSDSLF